MHLFFEQTRNSTHHQFLTSCRTLQVFRSTYLADIVVGGNTEYTSERFMQESIQALAEVVTKDIIKALQASPFFSLCIDETTDVSVNSVLSIHS